MAGLFEKLNGRVYEGTYTAAEELPNGVFVVPSGATVAKVAAANLSLRMRVIEKTDLFGLKAIRAIVTDAGSDEVYFVENEWDIDDNDEYNETLYSVATGMPVKMKRPLNGETLIMSVSDVTYAALTVGAIVEPAAGGTIAAV